MTTRPVAVEALIGKPLPRASASDALDLVFIEGFVGETVIGIHDPELHRPQPVRIDLVAGVGRSLACSTDRIGDTIDYAEVRAALRALLASHGVQLLEALAERIAQLLLADFGAEWVRVAVAKPRKFDDVEAVGVVIERRRSAEDRLRGSDGVLSFIGAGMTPDRR